MTLKPEARAWVRSAAGGLDPAEAARLAQGAPAPEDEGPRRDEWRLVLVILAFAIAYAAVALRMGLMALADPAEPALGRSAGGAEPVRGAISDRDGRLLAANLPAWSLYTNPQELKDPVATARALDPIFPDMEMEEILARLDRKRRFVWVKRPVTPRQKQAIMDLVPAQPALKFGRRDMRVYPAGRMAAHILGGVRAGEERVGSAELVGQAGVEKYFDDRLRDPERPDDLDAPLALSIDLEVQAALTEELARGVARLNAKGGTAILMHVRTGEILAMVSQPDFDPNTPVERVGGGAESPRFDRAVSGVYELGSVFKPITAAIAIEAGVAAPDTPIETGSPIRAGRRLIRDIHAMPSHLSVTDIVRRSSNVGAARLALRVGTRRFQDYLRALGFFEPIPLEMHEAKAARPLLPGRWSDLSTMTISFGHGLSVGPLHLLSAYATLANGGRRVTPSLVKGGRAPGERVFSERTSAQMLQILRTVVVEGTGRRTDIPGYQVGGKTGSADKVRPGGGYYRNKVLSSFASVFPTSDPLYAMLVVVDEATDPETGSRQASRTAVPITAASIRRLGPLLGLWPIPEPVDRPDALTVGGTR
ncbi:MAG: peptidoglycan D,D-transpeptidase FtsI family protein [Paracoccaceae bacterium]